MAVAQAVTIPIRAFSRSEILQLYKECLTLIRAFPSIKRDELYEDIRTGEMTWTALLTPSVDTPGTRIEQLRQNHLKVANYS
jgi:hypothetical protein